MKTEEAVQKKTLSVTEVQGGMVYLSDGSRYEMPEAAVRELRIGVKANVNVRHTEEGLELYFWFTMLALAQVNFSREGRYLRARNERTNTEVSQSQASPRYAYAF